MATGDATRKLFDLSGRVAVVTGGNRGLGHAIAIALAHAGAAVAIMARDEDKNRAALADLRAVGVPALALKVDLMARARAKTGRRSSVSSLRSGVMGALARLQRSLMANTTKTQSVLQCSRFAKICRNQGSCNRIRCWLQRME